MFLPSYRGRRASKEEGAVYYGSDRSGYGPASADHSGSGTGRRKSNTKTIDAYHQAAKEIAALQPETIVVTTPHSIMYGDYFHISPGYDASGDFGQFRAAGVRIHTNYDTAFVEEPVPRQMNTALWRELLESEIPGWIMG